jgi:hypothetical protein
MTTCSGAPSAAASSPALSTALSAVADPSVPTTIGCTAIRWSLSLPARRDTARQGISRARSSDRPGGAGSPRSDQPSNRRYNLPQMRSPTTQNRRPEHRRRQVPRRARSIDGYSPRNGGRSPSKSLPPLLAGLPPHQYGRHPAPSRHTACRQLAIIRCPTVPGLPRRRARVASAHQDLGLGRHRAPSSDQGVARPIYQYVLDV